MGKPLKYFLYAVLGALVLIVFLKTFSGSYLNSASAFEWEKQVSVYFSNSAQGSSEDCAKVFPIYRVIPNAETFGPGALEALLNGLSENEKKSGYFTGLNDGVLLQKFEISNKVAYVDFNSRFNEGVAGSCRVMAIRAQIESTLNTLPDIDSVVISVNGQTNGILEP